MENKDYTLLFADGLHLTSKLRGFVNGYFVRRFKSNDKKTFFHMDAELVKIPIPTYYFDKLNLNSLLCCRCNPYFFILEDYDKSTINEYCSFNNLSYLMEKVYPVSPMERAGFCYYESEFDLGIESKVFDIPVVISLDKNKLEYKYLKDLREIRLLLNLSNNFRNLEYSYIVIFSKKIKWSQDDKNKRFLYLFGFDAEESLNDIFYINLYIPLFTLYQSFIFFFKSFQEWLMNDFLLFDKNNIHKKDGKIVRKNSKFSKFELAFLDFILNNKRFYEIFKEVFQKIVISRSNSMRLEPLFIENIEFPVLVSGTITSKISIKNRFDYVNILVTKIWPFWEKFVNWDNIKHLTYEERYKLKKLKERFKNEPFL